MSDFKFAANPFKLQRAIAAVGRDEAAVKAEYIRLGGLLVDGHGPDTAVTVDAAPTTTGSTEPEIVEAEEPVEAPVSPAKKKAAKKK